MLKKLQITFKVFILLFLLTGFSKADLLNPDKNIKPKEVVKIQLTGLQQNDLNYQDSGMNRHECSR
jgi:hypothetical protein